MECGLAIPTLRLRTTPPTRTITTAITKDTTLPKQSIREQKTPSLGRIPSREFEASNQHQ